MQRSLLLGIFAIATATSALAESPGPQSMPFESTKTRAQVQAELREYQAAGVNPWATSYNPLAHFRSTRQREDVQQEFIASRDEVRAVHGEDGGSAWLAQHRNDNQGAGSQFAGQPSRAQ